jgi:hypothetical protein
MKTFAEELRGEQASLARRFIHHTRPKGPLSLKEAMELAERMERATQQITPPENPSPAMKKVHE